MKYEIGMVLCVKCNKGWKVGKIEKIVGDWLFFAIEGFKTLKKVNVNWDGMFF